MPTFTFWAPVQLLAVISGAGPTVGGQTVTLIGAEFAYGSTVTFGGVSATNVVVVDANHITCIPAAHAVGLVNVVVSVPSNPFGGATLTNGYNYVAQAPTVTAINPNTGSTGGGEAVIITGTGFAATPTVKFGGTSVTAVVLIDTNRLSCTAPAHTAAVVDITVTNPDAQIGVLFSGYTYLASTPWTDNQGWWFSDDGLAGGTEVIQTPSVPKHARAWAKLSPFAASGSGMLGGFPAASVVYRNHMIYAGDDYTTNSTQPSIRIFDGISDRLMQRIPNTSAAVVSKAIVSLLLNDGTVYLTTFDSGTTSANFAGRVFAFDPLSQALTQLGADFTGGEIPYALTWHMDRLWLGTNKSDGSAAKIYYFRPNIDTVWKQDYTLTTSSAGGACSLQSFNGKLYVGTDAGAATFAQILVRDTAGAYTSSLTATGGSAAANNGFLSLITFNSNLYATYWNPDTPAVAKVYKFDGTTWTTVYNGAALTLRPFMLQFLANQYLYVVGGGDLLRASLIRSSNGTNWDELTAYLAGPTTETALPIYGVVGL